ncbi:MAG: hypothetical protein HOB32_03565 [Nitrospina sp.]|jgi:hypothetical protein|nr:hypothetical protein [Nitrospina sp.]MBT6600729.1 hypothetical protein [Nitrospina sp.]
MTLYELMNEYAKENPSSSSKEDLTPELGKSLSLLHSSLIQCELENEAQGGTLRLIADPCDIEPSHLSHFIIAYLPFNSITEKAEINHVLFDIYSFFNWLDKKKVPHGFTNKNISQLVKQLCSNQERCLKLSQLLDSESSRVLKDPPAIQTTLNDIFLVKKIEGNFISLKGRHQKKILRLRLPLDTIKLVQLNDYLDLILGDTSEKWVLLESGQAYPKIKNKK